MKYVAMMLLISVIVGCNSQVQNISPSSNKNDLAEINCQLLGSLKWEEHTLYEVTYQCMPKGWESFFSSEEVKSEILNISQALDRQVKEGWEISPSVGSTFKAMHMVQPNDAQGVILGQDPAPQPGLATGLSFSLPSGTPTSKVASVQRVFLEAENENICTDLDDGDASQWAESNVLLLNMALTIPCPPGEFCKIAKHVPLWEVFTGQLMNYIDTFEQPMSFILWGSKAKNYAITVKNPLHKTFEGGHPSPKASSEYFFCQGYFRCSNEWLVKNSAKPIDWNLSTSCSSKPACEWEWDSETRTSSCKKVCKEQACSL